MSNRFGTAVRRSASRVLLAFLTLISVAKPTHATLLYGIDRDTSNLYSISTSDASLKLIGPTGIFPESAAALEFSPNGTLYSFSTPVFQGPGATLYKINPTTAAETSIGTLGLDFVFEGGLAFSPTGIAYGVGTGPGGDGEKLFTLDLNTGAATVVTTISGELRDLNGLAWRSDSKLIALDRVTQSLLVIDPATGSTSLLAALSPAVGAVGGMTAIGSSGYFSTGGPNTPSGSGSNALYAFNPFTGSYSLIGSFPSNIGTGISGIAAIPEPSTLLLIGVGMLALVRTRHSRRR